MILYEDVISGDEIASEAYHFREVDGIVYEFDSPIVTISGGPTEEDGEEKQAYAIVHQYRLQPQSAFDKREYLSHLRDYLQRVKAYLESKGSSVEEITAFQKGAQAYVREKILPNLDDFKFYTGESSTTDGMLILLSFRQDGTPYIIVWKHGLSEVQIK